MLDQLLNLFHMPCMLHEITGLYCPGCGATRSVRALAHGQLTRSFLYNPFIPYMVLAAFILIFFVVKYKIRKKKLDADRLVISLVLFGVGLLLVNWLVKDYLLLFRGLDVLKNLDLQS